MELMSGCSLARSMQAPARSRHGSSGERLLGWYQHGQRVALQIASGLAFLHSKGALGWHRGGAVGCSGPA